MEIIKQCQRVALKCRKMENKRVEILQNAADEIDRLSKHISLLGTAKKSSILSWTKTFKRSIDNFCIFNYCIDYDSSLYILGYDEYYEKQNINVHLKSFETYNKLLIQYENLRKSNNLLIKSLKKELNRLENILCSLTNDILILYDIKTISYSKKIVSGYIRNKFKNSNKYILNIINIIYRYYRKFEFCPINYYYNDENENESKYDNLLLQNTNINNMHNLAVFNVNNNNLNNNKSEMIVIDDILSYENNDDIIINLRIYGKPAIGFMKEIIYKKKKKNKTSYKNHNEYILLNGQQSAMLSDNYYDDDIPLTNDPKNIFKYTINAQSTNTIFHGINDVQIKVNMIQKTAKIKIKSVSNQFKEIEYNFINIPDNIYIVARVNSIGNKIAIL